MLFRSSLYVVSLSYKNFRNAAFRHIFYDDENDEEAVSWQLAIRQFLAEHVALSVHTETITAGTICLVLVGIFFYILGRNTLVAPTIGTALLIGIALVIVGIDAAPEHFVKRWHRVEEGFERELARNDADGSV